MTRVLVLSLMLGLALLQPELARAQGMDAKPAWRQAALERIARQQRVPLEVIVVDAAGQPVPLVAVRPTLLRWAFPLGFTLTQRDLEQLPEVTPAAPLVGHPFNSISLHPLGAWHVTQAQPDPAWDARLQQAVNFAQQRQLQVRWGELISMDLDRAPAWLHLPDDAMLAEALAQHLRDWTSRFPPRVGQVDLLGDLPDHRQLLERLGAATVRRLFETAQAGAPQVTRCVRFEQAFAGERLQDLIRTVAQLREAFVPVDAVTLSLHVAAPVDAAQMLQRLAWLHDLDVDLLVDDLRISAADDAQAQAALETTLLLLLGESRVRGIWMGPVAAEDLSDPRGALLDAAGAPTALAKALRGLVTELSHPPLPPRTDARGVAQLSLWAGLYDLAVELPGGAQAMTSIYLAPGAARQRVLLQPMNPQVHLTPGQ